MSVRMVSPRRAPKIGEAGYERRAHDDYQTPGWVTDLLLDAVTLRGKVWECAASDGRMVQRLRMRGYAVRATDIRPLEGNDYVADFLHRHEMYGGTETIATNPPYSQAESFVRHAFNLTDGCNGIVAMLLRHDWDTAGGRRDLSEMLTLKIVITKRIRWVEDSTGSPRENHAWYVWDHLALGKRHTIYPTISATMHTRAA